MTFTPKNWHNENEGKDTPLTAEALEDLEARLAAYAQPLDTDLTQLAELATTTFGRSLLTLANVGAAVTLLGAEITTNKNATNGYAGLSSGLLSTSQIPTIEESKLASAVKTRLAGATIIPVGFSIISTVESRTYRGFYAAVASGETKKLVGMKYSLGEGTKAKFAIKQNGTAIAEFKEKEAVTTAGEVTGKSVTVAAGDRFDLTVESFEGTPKDLIVTLFFESTH